ncbi:hypothetical protein [Leptospira andrefontaineae]|uniref:Uncharacterized protein n=1 Tax=Leptospira andrefontaineae TaxID=2484976 RepID=A0A4R9GX15_9LEPT|nr:hypothetical protein [Leptospira andrefontaineae]TGK36237.1 hypothetical protein EHO65_18205 [Leptospira andrefontaineae]
MVINTHHEDPVVSGLIETMKSILEPAIEKDAEMRKIKMAEEITDLKYTFTLPYSVERHGIVEEGIFAFRSKTEIGKDSIRTRLETHLGIKNLNRHKPDRRKPTIRPDFKNIEIDTIEASGDL